MIRAERNTTAGQAALTCSVVTPSLNQLPWLKQCAASIVDQQGVRVEHLVQDAGTGRQLDEWAAGQTNLKLCVEKDDGMYDAVNRGLSRAQGDICSYLNCDEQYLPGALAAVANYFQAHPECQVLFGDALILRRSGKPIGYRRAVLPRRRHTRLAPLAILTCATFFRRSVVEAGHRFDTSWKVIGDAAWVYGLLEAGVKMAVLPQPLAAYTMTGENLSECWLAAEELRRWRAGAGAWRALTLPVVIHHRLRKFLAGAYTPRTMDVDLYCPDLRNRRKTWKQVRLNNSWSKFHA